MNNPLISLHNNCAYDYFARLGGSGRYNGFMEWHPAALIILLVNMGNSKAQEFIKDWNSPLPSLLWEKTDNLPNLLTEKLNAYEVTQEMLDELIAYVTISLTKMKRLHPNELTKWKQFLLIVLK